MGLLTEPLKGILTAVASKICQFPAPKLNLGYQPVEVVAVPWDRVAELGARLFCIPNTVRGIESR